VVCSGASFKTPGGKLESPHIFVLGYRSPSHKLDFRSNDLGILFKDIHFAPQQSRFSVTAVGASHSIEVTWLNLGAMLVEMVRCLFLFEVRVGSKRHLYTHGACMYKPWMLVLSVKSRVLKEKKAWIWQKHKLMVLDDMDCRCQPMLHLKHSRMQFWHQCQK
jgi:hypothetical protein